MKPRTLTEFGDYSSQFTGLLKNLESESVSCSIVSDSLRPHGLQSARLLCLWNFPGKNTWKRKGLGCHSLLQRIFSTQGSNLGLLHYRQIFYHLSYQGSPKNLGLSISLPLQFSSVQSLSHVRFFATLQTAALQASLSIINSWILLKLMPITSVMPSNHLILCRPLLLPPSVFPSIRVFSSESVLLIRWPKYWSFNFNISSSNKYSGLISFRMDWLDLLAVQGTLKSSPTPQFKSTNSSALSFLYDPALTSIHGCWKNHSFDQTDLCW